MNGFARFTSFGLACSLVAAALGTSALARSVPATYGRPIPASDAPCFGLSFGTVTNVCTATKLLEFPQVMDGAGNFTSTVYAKGNNSSQNVGCQANGLTNGLGVGWISWWWDSYRYLPTFGTYQAVSTSAYVPANGGAYVTCNVDPGAILSVTTW
jgi:hypothetical protein